MSPPVATPSGPSHAVFSALAADVTWFFLAPEIRVLHVATSGSERPVALHQLTLSEGHPHNRSPFFVLEDAHLAIESGWLARAERMAVIHAERRELLAKEGMSLGAIPALVHRPNELATFGEQLRQCLAAQRSAKELHGLVVVLAPGVVEESAALVTSIVALTKEPDFADVRFIVLELGDTLAPGIEKALGSEAVLRARCEVDPEVYRREHLAAMAAAASAPVGAAPEQLAGGAAPKGVVPPDQMTGGPTLDPKLLEKELGAAAALMGAAGVALRQDILGAAVAVQEGKGARAIELQTKAVRACAGLPRLSCLLELILATYHLSAKNNAAATKTFEGVAARAEKLALLDIAALAFTGMGAVLAASESRNDTRDAIGCYTRAGELAERNGEPMLAIESHRMAGQLAARMKAENGAIAAWKRALAVASTAAPEVAAFSSAPLAARALAKVLQTQGSLAAAKALLDQADEMERGVPEAPEPSPHTEQVPSTKQLPETV